MSYIGLLKMIVAPPVLCFIKDQTYFKYNIDRTSHVRGHKVSMAATLGGDKKGHKMAVMIPNTK